jgi:hypothetical protein
MQLGEIESASRPGTRKRKSQCGEFKEKEFEVRLGDFCKRLGNGKSSRTLTYIYALADSFKNKE